MMMQDAAVNAPPQQPQMAQSPIAIAGGQPQPQYAGDGKIMSRTSPEPTEARKALVKEILESIKDDKAYFKGNFNKMRRWQRFARGMQWEDTAALESVDLTASEEREDERYVANVVQRHIQQEVATLYAKNPTVTAKRTQRMDFAVWDGKMSTIQSAMQAAATGMIDPVDPMGSPVGQQVIALQQDIAQGVARRTMLDKVAQTLEIFYAYNQNNYLPNLKRQMKQMVRRTKVCGVGYVKLGYQRAMQHSPDTMREITDITNRIAALQAMAADIADGELDENSAEAEKLRLSMQDLQAKPDVIVYEGLTWNFPKSTAIIPDMNTIQLDGWVGSDHVTEEFVMTADRIKQVYGIDMKSAKGTMTADDIKTYKIIRPAGRKKKADDEFLVYERYDKISGLKYTVCDGYCDFMEEPMSPAPLLERFFPYFTLAFNDIEDDNEIFPLSDVELMRHSQVEHNRAREGLSQHREHNKPMYVSKVPLSDEDKAKLKNREAFEILVLNATNSQQGINDILQAFENSPIDPQLYTTDHLQLDMQLTVGSDEAAQGVATGGATATESSIAAGARSKAADSNVDDLDDLLTALAREGGQVLLMMASPETVTKVVGPGAVWPQLARADVAQEIYLTIQAGSSGRPNQAQDLANFERAAPVIMQIPGVNPESFGRYALGRLDPNIDLDEMITDGLPSMVAQNAMASKPPQAAPEAPGAAPGGNPAGGQPQPSTGHPGTDPNQQGAQGANNAPKPEMPQQGPQPGMQQIQYGPDGKRVQ
jgi:hypothetical protein